MTHKLNITVDDDVYDYIRQNEGKNRSAFITGIIRNQMTQEIDDLYAKALAEAANDVEYQAEIALWDNACAADGLNDVV